MVDQLRLINDTAYSQWTLQRLAAFARESAACGDVALNVVPHRHAASGRFSSRMPASEHRAGDALIVVRLGAENAFPAKLARAPWPARGREPVRDWQEAFVWLVAREIAHAVAHRARVTLGEEEAVLAAGRVLERFRAERASLEAEHRRGHGVGAEGGREVRRLGSGRSRRVGLAAEVARTEARELAAYEQWTLSRQQAREARQRLRDHDRRVEQRAMKA